VRRQSKGVTSILEIPLPLKYDSGILDIRGITERIP